tara:strand:+ start:34 stop:558 length:525 start_codon:yes stop_codon:yes gene_type:complete
MKFACLIAVAAASKTVPFPTHDCANPTNPDAFVPSPGGEEISVDQMNIEIDYFSRDFEKKHYNAAMAIYGELKKQGKDPYPKVHTWELYDRAFPFEKVRRYDLVQQHMNMLEHFEDNLNENITNGQAVDNFIIVAQNAKAALNAKYHDGEFSDPANHDPTDDHPTTWSSARFGA